MTNISSHKNNRILILSHKFLPFVGGIEVMSLFLANTIVKAGYKVKILTWTHDKYTEDLPFEIIRNPKLSIILKEFRWANLILENNPTLRLSWPLVFFKKPLIIVLHTWLNRTNSRIGWQDRLKKIWLKRANKIITVSNALREKNSINAEVIMNPYRAEEFKILKEIKRNKDFVFLGRLVSDKGTEHAIKAIFELNKLGYNMNLTIIGEGSEFAPLEKLTENLQLTNKVTFTGVLRGLELTKMLNQHRFILVPSLWEEPFGLVALEGMACGCIPVVSDGGGLPEAVGNAGLIFKRGNLDSLVSCIRNLLDDAKLESKLKEEAENHLKNHHSNVVGKKYLQIINNILNKNNFN